MCENGEEADELADHEPFIIAVDIGTTSLRSHIYNKDGAIKGTSSKKIIIMHPQPGWVEMDPQLLYQQTVDCITESVKAAGIRMKDVTCLGISTQRNTCLTWDSETGEPYHNFISWQDMRASDSVQSWNNSYSLRLMNGGSKFLHTFTRKKRFLSGSVLKFMTPQVTLRLLWLLDNIPNLRPRANDGLVMFGCIDTWLLWKLTGGTEHATDYSSASSTGLFDPFLVEWSTLVCGLVNIPMSIFPKIKSTSGLFGHTDEAIFGASIPITCLAADQSASMFGECCFEKGDIKCTLGTGMFMSVNTGSSPHASIAGLYPLVGWKIGDQPIVYVAEGICADSGSVIDWAQSMGFFEDVRDTASIAESVEDTDGVYYVSAFGGLQAPICDDKACSLLLGMQPSTTKAHVVRAILESICFRYKLLFETFLQETKIPLSYVRIDLYWSWVPGLPRKLYWPVRVISWDGLKVKVFCKADNAMVDGGVGNNEFIVQLMADLTNQTINRSKQAENMTSLGTAFLAGLAVGVWKDKSELQEIRITDKIFEPRQNWSSYKRVFHEWERAVRRSRQWYPETKLP